MKIDLNLESMTKAQLIEALEAQQPKERFKSMFTSSKKAVKELRIRNPFYAKKPTLNL